MTAASAISAIQQYQTTTAPDRITFSAITFAAAVKAWLATVIAKEESIVAIVLRAFIDIKLIEA